MDISAARVTHLRKKKKQEVSASRAFCPSCKDPVSIDNEDSFRSHVQNDPQKHAKWVTDEDIIEAYHFVVQTQTEQTHTDRPQPETRPVTHDQLVAEVKGIYAGLVMIETKCIELDNAKLPDSGVRELSKEQWQALISLHRTLLEETLRSAGLPLYWLASKNSIPARMWRHDIHSVSKPLRHRRPASLDGPKQRHVLPINLKGKTHHALADTMASKNVMSEEHATSIGAVIDRGPGTQHTFTNAVGKSFQSLGETTIEVSFPDDPLKKIKQTFAVVKNCAAALVMGDPFLRMTETLTKFRHRLKKVAPTVKKRWRLCYMDIPHRQLSCSIAGHSVLANADTGSEIDLLSLEYTNMRGWSIEKLGPDDGYVELADTSIAKLTGHVNVWLDVGGKSTWRTFYVLNRLQCDVLLGDETLHSLNAFSQHESLFVDRDFVGGRAEFHAIKWKERTNDHVNQILEDKLPPELVSAAPSPDAKRGSLWKHLVSKVSGISAVEDMRGE
ncbi:unnamed protein product [Clonostachys rhizophaga]|uniref:Uncharacterized protein n=1 Tax=Clonostachys rhizophaga TaxID=160324 RepID=A0A9N9VNJ0_9HYPO|nr:unnamed protein product [Clonostachys rhizophaga]